MAVGVRAVQPIERWATYELVVEQVRKVLHLGLYLPGDRLPPERELANQLGVSRLTVREALRVLEAQGYVETRRGSGGGSIVLVPDEPFERIRERMRTRAAELMELVDLREVIESATARMAATRRTDEDIASLEAILAATRSSEDFHSFRRQDSAFHLAVADAARNRYLRAEVERARAAMFLPMEPLEFGYVLEGTLTDHGAMFDALVARDEERAEAVTRGHLRRVRDEFRQILEHTDGGGRER